MPEADPTNPRLSRILAALRLQLDEAYRQMEADLRQNPDEPIQVTVGFDPSSCDL